MTVSCSEVVEWVNVPILAKETGLSRQKLLGWIASGELVAVNLAISTTGKRPRWSIRRSDWNDFLLRRQSVAPSPAPVRRKKSDVPSYV